MTKADIPVTHNRGQAEGLSVSFDALCDQLFKGALAGGGDVVKALTVKWPEVRVSCVCCVFGKGNDGVRWF